MMKERLIRIRNTAAHIGFLLLVLIVSLVFFERMLNEDTPDSAETMEKTTFPLVYMNRNGINFNCLFGYANEMDTSQMRDCITPLTSERKIDIEIQTFSANVESVSYEVLTLDGETSLENTKVFSLEQKDQDTLYAQLQLQNKMLMDQEYMLKIQVTSGGRNIYYYTQILLSDGLHTDNYLSFVSGFYDKTVTRTDLNTVGAAVEPDDTTDIEQTLAYMDIHDSVSQLTWANLQPQIYYKPTPRIKEINGNTASLTMEYRIAAVGSSGMTEIYNIHEFYRVRFTDSRVFLLDFERTTDEVFNPENDVLSTKGIRLGITGKDVEYDVDEKGKVIAFVQENELWTYQKSSSRLTQVFSFPQKENMDLRDFHDASDIRILKVESNGDLYFTVTGYMNRGAHEGENGVLLCHYDAATDMVEELVFLKSMESYDLLAQDVDTLAYITSDRSMFYVYMEEQLWRVRLTNLQTEAIKTGVIENCCCGSDSGRYFAWLEEGDEYGSTIMNTIDLETGACIPISCGEDEKIKPLCYMKEDLVYGLAKNTDLTACTLQSGYFPMYALLIVNGEGSVLKEYQENGLWVTNVDRTDNMLNLTRMSYNALNGYTEALPDQIVNTDTGTAVATGTATEVSSRKQTQVYLRIGSQIDDTDVNVIYSKVIKNSDTRAVSIPSSPLREGMYRVYAHGGLYKIFSRPNEAVACADENVGTVIDGDMNYIWIRGNKSNAAKIPLEKVPDFMKNGIRSASDITDESVRALDLSGCTLEEVLYYVSKGTPVAAMTDQGPVTIVGYDEYNTYLLAPGTDEWYYYGINDSTELFAKSGNQFFTYVEKKTLS